MCIHKTVKMSSQERSKKSRNYVRFLIRFSEKIFNIIFVRMFCNDQLPKSHVIKISLKKLCERTFYVIR